SISTAASSRRVRILVQSTRIEVACMITPKTYWIPGGGLPRQREDGKTTAKTGLAHALTQGCQPAGCTRANARVGVSDVCRTGARHIRRCDRLHASGL